MARKWTDLKKSMTPAARARIDARVKATLASMPLAEIRRAIGLTQMELAEELDLGQGSVSKIENATDMYLSTLRRFIEALGGELTLRATFPGGREFVIDELSSVGGDDKEAAGSHKPARKRRRA